MTRLVFPVNERFVERVGERWMSKGVGNDWLESIAPLLSSQSSSFLNTAVVLAYWVVRDSRGRKRPDG